MSQKPLSDAFLPIAGTKLTLMYSQTLDWKCDPILVTKLMFTLSFLIISIPNSKILTSFPSFNRHYHLSLFRVAFFFFRSSFGFTKTLVSNSLVLVWKGMADKPSRALVLYGDGLARFLNPSHTHLHSLASLASCGFLALPHYPPSGFSSIFIIYYYLFIALIVERRTIGPFCCCV